MIYVKDNVINLNRGDDGVLTVPLKNSADHSTYTLGQNEYLIFALRKLLNYLKQGSLKMYSGLMSPNCFILALIYFASSKVLGDWDKIK